MVVDVALAHLTTAAVVVAVDDGIDRLSSLPKALSAAESKLLL